MTLPSSRFFLGSSIGGCAVSARYSIASVKLPPLVSMMRLIASPDSPQPKQWYVPVTVFRLNEGVFSSWKGQRALPFTPLI